MFSAGDNAFRTEKEKEGNTLHGFVPSRFESRDEVQYIIFYAATQKESSERAGFTRDPLSPRTTGRQAGMHPGTANIAHLARGGRLGMLTQGQI